MALGTTHEALTIQGATSQFTPGTAGPVATASGGLFALPGNAGRFIENRFSVIPEVDLKLKWEATSWLQCTVGYNFMFWNSIMRPVDQIPGTINTSFAPSQASFGTGGPPMPGPLPHHSNLYIDGVNFGLQFCF